MHWAGYLDWQIALKLVLALFFGALLGVERIMAHKTAGIRTYGLVSMGSALFVAISDIVVRNFGYLGSFDPLRMASQIAVGVGFLGAGIIIFRGSRVSGLTTAAGLWVSAGIGIACGFGMYFLALFATLLTLFVFTALWFLERKIKKISEKS